MFADDSVGISGTAEGLQEQFEKALEYTRNRRVTADVDKRAVLVRNGGEKNPVDFGWNCGGEELPVVDQYAYLPWRRYLKTLSLGCAHK